MSERIAIILWLIHYCSVPVCRVIPSALVSSQNVKHTVSLFDDKIILSVPQQPKTRYRTVQINKHIDLLFEQIEQLLLLMLVMPPRPGWSSLLI